MLFSSVRSATPSPGLVAAATTRPVLEARGVTKVFREGREEVSVLNGVDITVGPGEVVALEGPSGSGKTTFLSILGCILTPTSGRVVVDGEEIDARRPRRLPAIRKKSIGFVFQQYNLFPALTALENVEYALEIKGFGAREAKSEARAAIEKVGLADRADFLPRDLSGGQKQRVAIARALAGRPRVLLADEPTANLDTAVGKQILALFRELAVSENRGLLVVTHDPNVRTIADRIVRIRDGRIVGSTDPEPAPSRPAHESISESAGTFRESAGTSREALDAGAANPLNRATSRSAWERRRRPETRP